MDFCLWLWPLKCKSGIGSSNIITLYTILLRLKKRKKRTDNNLNPVQQTSMLHNVDLNRSPVQFSFSLEYSSIIIPRATSFIVKITKSKNTNCIHFLIFLHYVERVHSNNPDRVVWQWIVLQDPELDWGALCDLFLHPHQEFSGFVRDDFQAPGHLVAPSVVASPRSQSQFYSRAWGPGEAPLNISTQVIAAHYRKIALKLL